MRRAAIFISAVGTLLVTTSAHVGYPSMYEVYEQVYPGNFRVALDSDGGFVYVIQRADTLLMWIEHHSPGSTPTLTPAIAGRVDVIVTCWPRELPEWMRDKHVFPNDPDVLVVGWMHDSPRWLVVATDMHAAWEARARRYEDMYHELRRRNRRQPVRW